MKIGKLVSFTVAFAALCFFPVGALGQEKLRRIYQPPKFAYKNTPITVGVRLDGNLVPSREMSAGDDWLSRISLEVTNTAKKDIKFLWINLFLREPVLGIRNPTRKWLVSRYQSNWLMRVRKS